MEGFFVRVGLLRIKDLRDVWDIFSIIPVKIPEDGFLYYTKCIFISVISDILSQNGSKQNYCNYIKKIF